MTASPPPTGFGFPVDLDFQALGWAQQDCWTLLDTAFGQGERFLACWQAWRTQACRPRRLHVLAFSAERPNWSAPPSPLAGTTPVLGKALRERCWGLLPGCHRLVFDSEHVQLTLFVGPLHRLWRAWRGELDCAWLSAPSPLSAEHLRTLAHQCKPGARLLALPGGEPPPSSLRSSGFTPWEVLPLARPQPSWPLLQARYQPSWTPRRAPASAAPSLWSGPRQALIIGAGLAGASVARSLAQRGWQVRVLDRAAAPAAGASGLPAGVLAPQLSADDNVLSRLTRAGLRATWQRAQDLLRPGLDWQPCGVLHHAVDSATATDTALDAEAVDQDPAWSDWVQAAPALRLQQAGLPLHSPTRWYPHAGWIQAAALVRALLAHPGIEWQGNSEVQRIMAAHQGWLALDAQDRVLAGAPLMVLANAMDCLRLVPACKATRSWELHTLRGQLSWGLQAEGEDWPDFALNGHGNLISQLPTAQGPAWLMGASYERESRSLVPRLSDHVDNLTKLDRLAPAAAALARRPDRESIQAWTGLRCASVDRLPLLGPVTPAGQDLGATPYPEGLQVLTGLGSRGLSLATLCGELLAAALEGEPWPVEARLAKALWATRHAGTSAGMR